MVVVQLVRRYADDFDIALGKVGLATGDLTELGRADRGEVSGVGEQDGLITVSELNALARVTSQRTQELPIHSWNLMGPAVVWASKSGAMLPSRREGILWVF